MSSWGVWQKKAKRPQERKLWIRCYLVDGRDFVCRKFVQPQQSLHYVDLIVFLGETAELHALRAVSVPFKENECCYLVIS